MGQFLNFEFYAICPTPKSSEIQAKKFLQIQLILPYLLSQALIFKRDNISITFNFEFWVLMYAFRFTDAVCRVIPLSGLWLNPGLSFFMKVVEVVVTSGVWYETSPFHLLTNLLTSTSPFYGWKLKCKELSHSPKITSLVSGSRGGMSIRTC